MKSLVLPWHEMLQKGHIKSIGTETSCTELLKRFDGVFEEGIGELKGTMAAVKVKEGSAARFFKPRPVPYAYRAKVEHELKRLEAEGIIEPVRFANWAAPIVPILKADGSIRICGDYRLTVNQVAETEKYPLPRVEDIFASVGIGAVLSHQYPDGGERPIAYASRSLTKAEQGYAQIDREALSVVFGVKRFRQYVFGHQFTIFTDHKPLLTLLGENRGVPAMCSGRVQRWSLMLSSYQYTMTYRPGSLNSNADGLSRLPSSGVPDEEEEPVEAVLALQTLSSPPTLS